MKIVLVPKLTNPFICRFFEPRYAFDTGVLAIGSYVREKASVSIKSIFGNLGRKYLTARDMEEISGKEYLEGFAEYILAGKPDIVGLSTLDTSLINSVILARAIKEISRTTRIILGGPGVFYK